MVQAAEAKRPKPAKVGAVLAFTTRAEEAIGKVSIDGVRYDLANPAEFGLRQGGRIARAMNRVVELEALAEGKETSDDDETEYRTRLLEIAAAALPDAPAATVAKLKTGALSDLVVHFFGMAAMVSPRLPMLIKASRRIGTT